MKTLVMKFGGTSVGGAPAVAQAAAIVQEQAQAWEHLVVIVSAMRGVTDALIQGARTAASGDGQTYPALVTDLRVKHTLAVAELLNDTDERAALLKTLDGYLDEFATFCRSVQVLGEVTPRAMDAISSLGERMNARIVAARMRQMGLRSEAVDATELIVTDRRFQQAAPLMDLTRARTQARLLPLLEAGIVPVVTGFIGATEDGITTTLGRGGSDYSASILGAALDADEVWTWTDVDGVLTTDPRIVPDARVIPVLSYSEVGELAYFGAKVLHPKTISPVVERGIPLWVKNTFNPTCPGTRIVREPESTPGTVKAVSAIKGLSMVNVEGRGMMGVPGIAARTFAAVASQGASVLMISQASSEQSICFVIPTETAAGVIAAIEEEMALELSRRDIDRVWSMDNVVIVTAVGAGMRHTPGVAARLFVALARKQINVIAIAQGSSECSISLVVAADQATEAVRQLHSEVINGGSKE
ncbi:MAG TPA: aspartate kinase [Anaerolineae bacterium]|nr:aspartate kinase [Anaerolineae bacterium]HQI85723.1 aspartate kinase [Anaerolineae bacterium]